ncbi:MAG: thioredoxin domain-containing protein [Candidatus Saliniplasma sp.]
MGEKNHLAGEKSRYLEQHATNPVNWYPWGEEAFEKARSEDKPIFLSIGYSSCHWCHVMAHESFEDEEVAELMNQTFVSIKVDKEERPDVDMVYMDVARAMTGSGGWPLNVVITPDKKPFYTATYIPKESKYGRIGFKELIKRLKHQWGTQRQEVLSRSESIISSLEDKTRIQGTMDKTTLNQTYSSLERAFDEEYPGFGTAPKFPSPHNSLFLLRYHELTGESKALEMVTKTLDAMRKGGIYDHIGYGFHRYSTDRQWKLPHFEKMLYDQAMLILAYSEAFRITKKKNYRKTVEETIEYVLRDLRSDDGGFFSSEDADVDGEEGKYYTWTEEEIDKILGDQSEGFKRIFNVKSEGNYLDESTGKKTGRNVLYTTEIVDLERVEGMRSRLYQVRKKRKSPGRDEKILTDWNGLMIASLARAAYVLDDDKILKEAEKGLEFILTESKDNFQLYHRYIQGQVGIDGMLDDYAYLIWALLEIYRASEDAYYLDEAKRLSKSMIEKFWDDEDGGFYFSLSDELPLRKKPVYDGAYPSGNSMALLGLTYLSEVTDDRGFKEKAEELINSLVGRINSYPSRYTMFMTSYELFLKLNGEEI